MLIQTGTPHRIACRCGMVLISYYTGRLLVRVLVLVPGTLVHVVHWYFTIIQIRFIFYCSFNSHHYHKQKFMATLFMNQGCNLGRLG